MQRGFTLIELSIVLVIIGLLAGGVLVGRDMLEAADVRSQVTQINKIVTATHAFRSKYHALPGDMHPARASSYNLPALFYVNDRYENAFVDGQFGNQPETWSFFAHLDGAGLIKCAGCDPAGFDYLNATFDDIFTSAELGDQGVMHVYGGRSWENLTVETGSYPQNMIEICERRSPSPVSNALTPQQAYAVDAKIDDGFPLTGDVKATNSCAGLEDWSSYWRDRSPSSGAAGSAACVSTSTTPASYNTQNGDPLCNLQTRAGF